MDQTIGDALIYGVTALKESIVDIAPDLWRIMIRQQYANVVRDFIWVIILAITVICVGKYVSQKFKEHDSNRKNYRCEWDVGEAILTVFGVAAIIVSLIVMCVSLTEGISILINPEYYAIKEMINLVIPQV